MTLQYPFPQDFFIWQWPAKAEGAGGAVWPHLREQASHCCTYPYDLFFPQLGRHNTLNPHGHAPFLPKSSYFIQNVQVCILSRACTHVCNLMAVVRNIHFLLTISQLEQSWFVLRDGLILKQSINKHFIITMHSHLSVLSPVNEEE